MLDIPKHQFVTTVISIITKATVKIQHEPQKKTLYINY